MHCPGRVRGGFQVGAAVEMEPQVVRSAAIARETACLIAVASHEERVVRDKTRVA